MRISTISYEQTSATSEKLVCIYAERCLHTAFVDLICRSTSCFLCTAENSVIAIHVNFVLCSDSIIRHTWRKVHYRLFVQRPCIICLTVLDLAINQIQG